MTEIQKRVIVWDILKLFAIFFVVWGHCLQHLLKVPVKDNPIFLWIYSFHMPLFMSLAGLFAQRTFIHSYSYYLCRRSKQLIIPWISWSIIILFVVYLLEGSQSKQDILVLFINSLWFLKSLFICGFLALIAFKPKKYNRAFWIIISFFLCQALLIWNIFTMYPCFLFGIYCAYKMGFINKHVKLIMIISGLIFISLSMLSCYIPTFW